jgi:hypothetical protein
MPKKEYAEATTQTLPDGPPEATDGNAVYKTATPRYIGWPQHQFLHHGAALRDSTPKMVQVREWMISAEMMFSSVPKTITSESIRTYLKKYYESLRTPLCVYSDAEEYMRTRLGRAQCGMESVLVPDGRCDALPEIEPITDWGWLLTMGLAQ